MVDVNRMTHKLQEALQQAGGLAARRNHQGIDVEHLLLALLDQEGGLAANLIGRHESISEGRRQRLVLRQR
jgi:ATP-dependent Clp protease ATP-binding subunit ClpB